MTRARVVLADDHAIFLQGLQHILQSEFEVVATASDGTSLIDEVLRHKPEVAVADLAMPEVDGLEALRQLKQHSEVSTRFVFLTASPDVPSATQAFRLGAHAYVPLPVKPISRRGSPATSFEISWRRAAPSKRGF